MCGCSQVTIVKCEEYIHQPVRFRFWHKAVHYIAIFAVLAGLIPAGIQPANAMFGNKTLTFIHMHTGESATITFARGGRYDQQALDKLNWLLRDWRTNEPIKMDPRLFDLLYDVYEQTGSREPIRVLSSYRSPKTNSMLRRRSKAVAEHSQHMLGKAMDFYLPDVSSAKIRAIAMQMQGGGVGYYPNSNSKFIHLDVGSVRAWPRMTRSQLSNLFPDGKTVHIPADGRPLPGYDAARQMILARGGKVAGTSYASADEPKRKSFWATLFGSRDEDEDEEEVQPRRYMLASSSRNARQQAVKDDDDTPATSTQPRIASNAPTPPVRVAAADPEPAVKANSEPVPLPPARQVAVVTQTPKGPQLVWQSGAQGHGPKGDPFSAAAGSQIALSPNGSGKPGDESLGSGVMTYAPLPPMRPGTAVASAKDMSEDNITTASISAVPLPPVRPNITKPTAVAALAPQQPAKVAHTKKEEAKAQKSKAKPQDKSTAFSQNSGFTRSVYADLSTNQFTGSTLKKKPKK
ncbi:DUF882 domain-containing protein [Microvirga sp. W0021]|uniref:Murein endopeptidase K n=1 Tax=Hohaiivirga grylli TaxID=3133970 RepID=A0ABV0BLV6_9HYPH